MEGERAEKAERRCRIGILTHAVFPSEARDAAWESSSCSLSAVSALLPAPPVRKYGTPNYFRSL